MKEIRTKTYPRLRSIAMILLSVVLCMACGSRELYNSYADIPTSGWEIQDSKTFTVDIPSPGHYDIDMFVRHNSEYKYRNLWLFVDHIYPDSTLHTDTINIELADRYGRWNGSGWGGNRQIECPISHTQQLDSGVYTIKITQAMREYNLKGVANVGVKVSNSRAEK